MVPKWRFYHGGAVVIKNRSKNYKRLFHFNVILIVQVLIVQRATPPSYFFPKHSALGSSIILLSYPLVKTRNQIW